MVENVDIAQVWECCYQAWCHLQDVVFREKCKALLFYFGSEHFCSFLFLSTEFRYCIYQSERLWLLAM